MAFRNERRDRAAMLTNTLRSPGTELSDDLLAMLDDDKLQGGQGGDAFSTQADANDDLLRRANAALADGLRRSGVNGPLAADTAAGRDGLPRLVAPSQASIDAAQAAARDGRFRDQTEIIMENLRRAGFNVAPDANRSVNTPMNPPAVASPGRDGYKSQAEANAANTARTSAMLAGRRDQPTPTMTGGPMSAYDEAAYRDRVRRAIRITPEQHAEIAAKSRATRDRNAADAYSQALPMVPRAPLDAATMNKLNEMAQRTDAGAMPTAFGNPGSQRFATMSQLPTARNEFPGANDPIVSQGLFAGKYIDGSTPADRLAGTGQVVHRPVDRDGRPVAAVGARGGTADALTGGQGDDFAARADAARKAAEANRSPEVQAQLEREQAARVERAQRTTGDNARGARMLEQNAAAGANVTRNAQIKAMQKSYAATGQNITPAQAGALVDMQSNDPEVRDRATALAAPDVHAAKLAAEQSEKELGLKEKEFGLRQEQQKEENSLARRKADNETLGAMVALKNQDAVLKLADFDRRIAEAMTMDGPGGKNELARQKQQYQMQVQAEIMALTQRMLDQQLPGINQPTAAASTTPQPAPIVTAPSPSHAAPATPVSIATVAPPAPALPTGDYSGYLTPDGKKMGRFPLLGRPEDYGSALSRFTPNNEDLWAASPFSESTLGGWMKENYRPGPGAWTDTNANGTPDVGDEFLTPADQRYYMGKAATEPKIKEVLDFIAKKDFRSGVDRPIDVYEGIKDKYAHYGDDLIRWAIAQYFNRADLALDQANFLRDIQPPPEFGGGRWTVPTGGTGY